MVGILLQKIPRDRIHVHLDKLGQIGECKHVVLCGIEIFEEVAKEIVEGRTMDIVCMDPSQTFVKVPQVENVKPCGIQDELCELIQNWLDDRKQVVVDEWLSD